MGDEKAMLLADIPSGQDRAIDKRNDPLQLVFVSKCLGEIDIISLQKK